MKKLLCMIALASICLGTVSAATVHTTAQTDTTKTKIKKKDGKTKFKKKMKDTTKKS
jgi:hypothetical protein